MLEVHELITKVAKHLLTQKVKATSKSGDCRYRTLGDNGKILMCAAGCCVSDEMYEKYSKNIEGCGIKSLRKEFERVPREHSLAQIFNTPHLDVLTELQAIHDCLDPEYWKGALAYVSQKNGISPSYLEAY